MLVYGDSVAQSLSAAVIGQADAGTAGHVVIGSVLQHDRRSS